MPKTKGEGAVIIIFYNETVALGSVLMFFVAMLLKTIEVANKFSGNPAYHMGKLHRTIK